MKIRKTIAASVIAVAASMAVFSASPAGATAVYDTSPATAGDQAYGDVLGNDFTVNVPGVTIGYLGAFNSTHSGIATDILIGLYDVSTSTWVTPLVNFNGTLNPTGAAYVWKAITPVVLTSGDMYSIVGEGFNGTDMNFNTNVSGQNDFSPIVFNSLGGALTNDFSRWGGNGDPSVANLFPHSSTFGAGSLAPIPEPATWAMFLVGFGTLGFMMRGSRRKDAAVTA